MCCKSGGETLIKYLSFLVIAIKNILLLAYLRNYIFILRTFVFKELLTFRDHLSSPRFLVGSLLLIFLVFVLSYFVALRSEFRVVISV
jgi:hypothetical protein